MELPNLAAWYDLSRLDSLVYDGSNRVQLIGDLSGNSAVNELVLNGAIAGNRATVTTAPIFGAGDFSISVKVRFYSFASVVSLINGNGNSLSFLVDPTGYVYVGKVGVGICTLSTTLLSTYTDYVIGYSRSGTTGTYYVNGVAAGTTADSFNYSASSPYIGGQSDGLKVVYGNIRWARCYSVALSAGQMAADALGAVQSNSSLDVDFSLAAKLATSFTATTGGVVTISTNGDLGARICGARDHVQMTAANQRVLTIDPLGNYATDDGSNDYSATANFSLAQPFTRYTLFKQKTWTSGDILWAGRSANTGKITQTGTMPNLQLAAASAGPQTNTFTLDTWAVMSEVVNGASSSIARNLAAATVADTSTGNPNGDTLGADHAGANNGNISTGMRLIYSAAHDVATQKRIAAYMIRQRNVPMP